MIENRKFIRLRTSIGIVYRLIKKHKRLKPTASLVKNISGGGLSLMAKEDLRTGDLLDMEIHIPHLEDPVCAIGEVVWFASFEDRERERIIREAGVRFRDVHPKDLHHILEYVYTIGIG